MDTALSGRARLGALIGAWTAIGNGDGLREAEGGKMGIVFILHKVRKAMTYNQLYQESECIFKVGE